MKKLKSVMNKNIRGDSTYVATVLSIFMIMVVFMGLLYVFGGTISRNDVERVQRKYLLAMEREGYLSDVNRANLTAELTNMGCSNISITGSLVPVGYGNTIVLKVECDLEVKALIFGGSGAQAGRRTIHVVIEKSGTALY